MAGLNEYRGKVVAITGASNGIEARFPGGAQLVLVRRLLAGLPSSW